MLHKHIGDIDVLPECRNQITTFRLSVKYVLSENVLVDSEYPVALFSKLKEFVHFSFSRLVHLRKGEQNQIGLVLL